MVSRADLASWPLIGARGAQGSAPSSSIASDTKSGAGTIRAMRKLLADGETVIDLSRRARRSPATRFARFTPAPSSRPPAPARPSSPSASPTRATREAAFVDETFVAHLARMAGGAAVVRRVSIGAPLAHPPRRRAPPRRGAPAKPSRREVARAREPKPIAPRVASRRRPCARSRARRRPRSCAMRARARGTISRLSSTATGPSPSPRCASSSATVIERGRSFASPLIVKRIADVSTLVRERREEERARVRGRRERERRPTPRTPLRGRRGAGRRR